MIKIVSDVGEIANTVKQQQAGYYFLIAMVYVTIGGHCHSLDKETLILLPD